MTRTVTLRKALQIRKTLAGDIARLTATITKYNAQRNVNPHIDVPALLLEQAEKRKNLIELKTKLAKANTGIYEAIITVDEAKAEIAFLESLNVEETGREYVPGGGGQQEYKITVAVNYTAREELVKKLRQIIEAGLEEIDAYNSNTVITIDF